MLVIVPRRKGTVGVGLSLFVHYYRPHNTSAHCATFNLDESINPRHRRCWLCGARRSRNRTVAVPSIVSRWACIAPATRILVFPFADEVDIDIPQGGQAAPFIVVVVAGLLPDPTSPPKIEQIERPLSELFKQDGEAGIPRG